MSPLLEHALAYAAEGWHIIPCFTPEVGPEGVVRCDCRRPGCTAIGKHPRTLHGFKEATTDADTIRKWWTTWPHANIGGLPGGAGLIAFDLDTPEHEAKARAMGLYAEPTREVLTPNGVHRYFRHTEVLNTGATLDGIIVRKSFGLTILPPSQGVHKATREVRPYQWADATDTYAEVPPRVAAQLRQGASRDGARERVQTAMSAERWSAGDRHPNLLTTAGTFAARHVPLEHTLEALFALNATKCDPPKDRDEVERLVRDVYAKEAAKAVTFDAPPMDAPAMEWAPPELPPELAATMGTSPTRGRPLSGFLAALEGVRSPDEAGGVPIPAAWECVRAILGRVDRTALEQELGASPEVQRAAMKGTHLPAGLHIITGQTGGGKSALVTNLALAAAKAGHPVLYVSLELDGAEIAARVLALESDVAWYKLAHWEPLEMGEQQARVQAAATLEGLGVPERFTVYAPLGGFTPGRLWGEVRTLWQTHGKVPLVVLDYLQLSTVAGPGGMRAPLREAIASVVLELRHLSRQREEEPTWPGCPVVVLSTTARSNVKGAESVQGLSGENPDELRLENLEVLKALPKEAGEIEATAVTAWVVALGERSTNGVRPLALRLVKSRMGVPGGWVPFEFMGATGRLREAPERYQAALLEDAQRATDRDTKRAAKSAPAKEPPAWTPTKALG